MSRFKREADYTNEQMGQEAPIWENHHNTQNQGPGFGAYGQPYEPPPMPPVVLAPKRRRRWPWVLLAVFLCVTALFVTLGFIGAVANAPQSTRLAPAAPADSALPTLVPAPTLVPEPTAPDLSAKQANALRSAQAYLEFSGFSRAGLIHQLVAFDKYTTSDATVAVGRLHVNWNDQAVRVGQTYLDMQGFSHAGLVKQLVAYDKFAPTQAEYAVNKLGL
jgi:hypothetical protein